MFLFSQTVSKVTLAVFACAGLSFGQGLTISARPGLVNYFEGEAFLNGNSLVVGAKEPKYLNANDKFWMKAGKGEILLMPGTFVRVGNNSEIHMVSPSLVNPRLDLLQGEAILEVMGLMRGNQIEIVDQGALIVIAKDGLYRLTAGAPATAAVIQGSAEVMVLNENIKLGKGRQTGLVGVLRSEKFEAALDDDLYAWSSVRAQYEAAASYDLATRLAQGGLYGAVGWYFNDVLDSWAWLPFGSFFSQFGWGFYSPVTVGSATIVRCSVLRGGSWFKGPHPPIDGVVNIHRHWVGMGTTRVVAIDPEHPPAGNVVTGSPQANREARLGGFRGFVTAVGGGSRGNSVRVGGGGNSGGNRAASSGGHSTSGAGGGHVNSGGGSMHSAGGGFTGGGGGGGHAGGGGGGACGGGGGSHK